MKHTFYGDLAGRFDATGGALFKRGWLLWLATAIMVVSLFAVISMQIDVLTATWPFIQLLLLPFIYGIYKVIEWRWWVSGIRFGDVSFESDLRRGAMIGLYWKVIGWVLLVTLALALWIGAVVGIPYMLSGFNGTEAEKLAVVLQQLPVPIAIGLGYLAYVLLTWMVIRIYLIHDVWQRVAESVTVHNVVAAHNVTTQGSPVGALGEGFAGSLDIGF
jgi:uncharacterized membrane protein YjgN (DUF898 family)